MTLETALFIGDWGTYRHIQDLCNAGQPLLHCMPHGEFRWPPDAALSTEEFRQQELSVTEDGRRVLSKEIDASAFRHIDFWLGGVHLTNRRPSWRWNDLAGRIEVVEG